MLLNNDKGFIILLITVYSDVVLSGIGSLMIMIIIEVTHINLNTNFILFK